MIREVAEITVKQGCEKDFEAGVASATPLFLAAQGCHGVSLHRVIETPNVYRLVVEWGTLDNHLVDFRNSDAFQKWRSLVSPFWEQAPHVTHVECVALPRTSPEKA